MTTVGITGMSLRSIAGTWSLLADHLNDIEKWRDTEARIERLLNAPDPPVSIKDLPCTTARAGGVTFRVHGIIHGDSLLRRPAERVRNFVRGMVRQYAEPSGLCCLCEERFSRYWGLHENLDIDDVTRRASALEEIESLLESSRGGCTAIDPESNEIRRRIWTEIKRAVDQALGDERHLGLVREIFEALPYPAILDEDGVGVREFLADLLRSKYMAEYMISYSAITEIPELHAVVGLGHEPEVAYFILHPEAVPGDCILALKGELEPQASL